MERRASVYSHFSEMQALESEAATLARQQRVTAALKNYRQQAGLEVDPVSEAMAKEAYSLGVDLMQKVTVSTFASLRLHEDAYILIFKINVGCATEDRNQILQDVCYLHHGASHYPGDSRQDLSHLFFSRGSWKQQSCLLTRPLL